jgi:hypothetical protein
MPGLMGVLPGTFGAVGGDMPDFPAWVYVDPKVECYRVFEGKVPDKMVVKYPKAPRDAVGLGVFFGVAPEVYGVEFRHPDGRKFEVLRSAYE